MKNCFDKIVFWEVIRKVIGNEKQEHDEILEDHTQQQILEAVTEIEKVIDDASRLTFAFLESIEDHLKYRINN